MRFVLTALAVAVANAGYAQSPAIQSLAVHPAKVELKNGDDAAQLIVTATLADGQLLDLTHEAKYAVKDAKVAERGLRFTCRRRKARRKRT